MAILGAGVAVALFVVSASLGDVVLLYNGSTRSSGTTSPLHFVNGGNYASAHSEGFVTVTYPTAQQVSLAAASSGANGAYGTYLLDVVEVAANTATTTGWHLRLDSTGALVGSGINALYVFDCTQSPTAVPDTGVPLANGTDAAGDVWAVFAPTCAGTQASISLLSVGPGVPIAVPALTSGTSVLYLSFAVDVSSSGASTTTSGTLTLVATSP